MSDVLLSPVNFTQRTAQYDLIFNVTEIGQSLEMVIEYCIDLFKVETIEAMSRHYQTLLNSILENPDLELRQLKMLLTEEEEKILNFSTIPSKPALDKTVIELFGEQVMENPNQIALIDGDKRMTYRELDQKSNILAAYLISEFGVKQTDLVGIMMEKSDWAIISILGILKSGAAYLPIDLDYPFGRKSYIINDAKPRALIILSDSMFDVSGINVETITIDIQFEEMAKDVIPDNKNSIIGENLVYVIYTSGSTGKPKGVMIEQRSLTNYLTYAMEQYKIENSPFNFPWFTSLSFDLTQTSIFLPLISGGQLTIESGSDIVGILNKVINNPEINAIKLTPAHISLLDYLDGSSPSIELAIVGGDRLEKHHIKIMRQRSPSAKIFNEYGPTEATIGSVVYEVKDDEKEILIGRPIANTEVFVLLEDQTIAPIGINGELYIGGAGLARGYINRSQLSEDKFLRFSSAPLKGKRLYRTGDLVRWQEDGSLDYLGRLDNQLKIRGYRIEVNEIETTIMEAPSVKNCVVAAQETPSGDYSLISYVIPNDEFDKSAIKAYISARLPKYMVPTIIMEIDELPLNVNGKVDRELLPKPDMSEILAEQYVAPRNDLEKEIASIWEEVLNVSRVGIHDDFFDLGGHSLIAMRLVALIQIKCQVNVNVAKIFQSPTVAELAEVVKSLPVSPLEPIGWEENETANVPDNQGFFIKDDL